MQYNNCYDSTNSASRFARLSNLEIHFIKRILASFSMLHGINFSTKYLQSIRLLILGYQIMCFT